MSRPPASPGLEPAHLELMRALSAQPETSQRELSRQLGWSIGKTHYLLRALVEKGLLKAQNFQRSNNKGAYAYLLTRKGMAEKLRLTHSFLIRKESEFEALQREIAALKAELEVPVSAGPKDTGSQR